MGPSGLIATAVDWGVEAPLRPLSPAAEPASAPAELPARTGKGSAQIPPHFTFLSLECVQYWAYTLAMVCVEAGPTRTFALTLALTLP